MIFLAQVIMTFRVMPEDPDVDLSRVESDIRSGLKVSSIEREPVAFGLNALKVVVSVDEVEGAADEAENKIGGIDGVGGVEVISVTRDM